ncbi:hypothetical protein N8Z47_03140 [Salibacteraceae bacterium]|nr:hypothetical protein [Salibacteraceae bacterium]
MSYIRLFGSIAISMALLSCGSESQNTSDKAIVPSEVPADLDTSQVFRSAQSIFYSMPSPLELTSLIKKAEGQYRKDLLHNLAKANIYQSARTRALALGVYGADLSYSTVYEQQGDAVKFLAASKRLGETIGIQEAFSAEIIERANANLDNRDSMMAIMTEMYWQTNSQLKEENRDQLALLVVAGGWIEGLYIGCSVYDPSEPNFNIQKRMSEQKFASQQLEEMFILMKDDYMVDETGKIFQPLFELFNSLNIEYEEPTVSENKGNGSVTIGGKTNIDMTTEQFDNLRNIVFELRAKIVEP